MDNEIVISREQQLADRLAEVGRIRFQPHHLTLSPAVLEREYDRLAALETSDGRRFEFALKINIQARADAVDRIRAVAARDNLLPLLGVVRLSDALLSRCRAQGVSCFDCNGRAWFAGSGLLIDVAATERRFRPEQLPPNPFAGKSQRLARVLLSHQSFGPWTQSRLCGMTGLSLGLISSVLNHFEGCGWVSGKGKRGEWTVTDPSGLLDAWAAANRWDRRGEIRQYHFLDTDKGLFAKRLLEGYGRYFPGIAYPLVFTQWFAAELRHPYASVPVVSAYCHVFPDEEMASRLGLTPVPSNGRLWLICPKDMPGMILKSQVVGNLNLPLVCDSQIYLDLLQVGLRGPDQAKALRECEGFCRP